VRAAVVVGFDLLTIALGWLIVWGCVALVRWVHRGFAAPKRRYLRDSFGSFAMFAAMRRASSRVSRIERSVAAAAVQGFPARLSVSEIPDFTDACPGFSLHFIRATLFCLQFCPLSGSSGRLGRSLGFQTEVYGHRLAQNIEYRAVRVDRVLQFGEIGGRRTAFQIDDAPDLVEASADTVFNREEAAQIE
jgi:hypothetical protein